RSLLECRQRAIQPVTALPAIGSGNLAKPVLATLKRHGFEAAQARAGGNYSQLSSWMRKGRPPFGVSVTVPLMPGGSLPTYSGRKRRSRIDSASVFSTWLMAPPMQERLPAPNGRYVYFTRFLAASPIQRSGRNSSGASQYFGLWCTP